MSEKLSFPESAAAALEPWLPPRDASRPSKRQPFVTLTYASSLDSSLSLAPGVRTRLSGPLSKAMTHYLRSRHDAILVGVSTVLADDPALNCRIAGATTQQPRPVVLDPRLRWTPKQSDKVFEVCRAGQGLAPFVLTAVEPRDVPCETLEILQQHGGKIIYVPATAVASDTLRCSFTWDDIVESLGDQGLCSIMVEGGAHVINTLLAPGNQARVDSVIITIAPVWLGQGGVVVCPDRVHDSDEEPVAVGRLKDVAWHAFGEDMVLCGRFSHDSASS